MKKNNVFAVLLFGMFILSPIASYAKMPSYKSVCSAIKNVEGWKPAGECSGTNMSGTSIGDVVVADKSFTKESKKIDVSVVSGMQAMASWGMFQANISIETDENIMKTTNIQGYRGGVSYDKKAHSGVVYICLKHSGDQCKVLFGLKFDNIKYDDAVDLVKHYDIKSIQSVF